MDADGDRFGVAIALGSSPSTTRVSGPSSDASHALRPTSPAAHTTRRAVAVRSMESVLEELAGRHHPVASAVLGAIEGRVRRAQQSLSRLAVAGENCDTKG